MKLLLLVVVATAFQTEKSDQLADPPTHTENHIRDCQLLDATHPFFSNFDSVEHDCDVSSNAVDTVEADTVMDMNELTCNLFCGKISHGDCQCDETECDKNDQLKANPKPPAKGVGPDFKPVGQGGTKCTDADSPVTAGGHDDNPAACAVDFECTMNGPMSYCGEAPETVDVAICTALTTADITTLQGTAAKWKLAFTEDKVEDDLDVSTQVSDLQHMDSVMDKHNNICTALCGAKAPPGDCQCDEDACDKKDRPVSAAIVAAIGGALVAQVKKETASGSSSACDLTDTCEQDFECLYLGGLEYCGQVSHEGAATFDVKMCNEIA